ncbi:MAG: twin-arginine translocation signal domain-containing protein [Bacteroidales bacterium]|jgi:sugar phosphate isomerase/epimerase|nr:twin-arginine translocation signal domain-containing protein [Bacteroidota bacterium]
MTNRRDFLKSSALLAAGGLVGSSLLNSCGSSATAAPARKSFIGLQTYSLGGELTADVPAGLKRVYDAGYTDLELAGYRDGMQGEYTMAEYKKMADDAGLKISGAHVGPSSRNYTKEGMAEMSEFWKKAVADHVILGVTTIVQPSMPTVTSEDDAKIICDIFNNAGQIAKDAGIKWGYHNHSGEFTTRIMSAADQAEADRIAAERAAAMASAAAGGTAPRMNFGRAPQGTMVEQLFLDNTDPELVMFELDCYWAVMGGQDPVQWLKNYPNRFKLLHVKDKWIIGNSGMMNWEMIFKTAYEIGIEQWFVELENDGDDSTTQFYGVEESAKYLLSRSFVKA